LEKNAITVMLTITVMLKHTSPTGLKGVSENPDVFLGGSVGCDPDGTMWWGAKCYIAQCSETYEQTIGAKAISRTPPIPEKSQL
jgi:hypothetical protein